jgi:Tol biopolymer transport system component
MRRTPVGTGSDEFLFQSEEDKWPNDWSSDGRFISFGSLNPKTKLDSWILPRVGDRKPFRIVQNQFFAAWTTFSPDRRWVAYTSDENGRNEVYVQPFYRASGAPGPVSNGNATSGRRWQVSTSGGFHQRWRRDGKELFFLTEDRKIMAVEIKSGPEFDAGIPKPLFESRFPTQVLVHPSYDVSADGQRFLINNIVGEEKQPITVVVNWQAGLKR